MNTEEIARIVGDQRAYFKTHATFDVDARRRALVRLREAVRAHETDIAHALKTDLGKSHDEAYMCEIGTSLSEIRHQIARCRSHTYRHLAFRDSSSDCACGSMEPSAPASV